MMNLEEFVFSQILILDSLSLPELALCEPEIEHQVQQFIPLVFAVAMNMCVNLGAMH
jgi:hypothetical protein